MLVIKLDFHSFQNIFYDLFQIFLIDNVKCLCSSIVQSRELLARQGRAWSANLIRGRRCETLSAHKPQLGGLGYSTPSGFNSALEPSQISKTEEAVSDVEISVEKCFNRKNHGSDIADSDITGKIFP